MATEKQPLGPEALAALRRRVIEIRLASAEAGVTPTARSIFESLCTEGGEEISIARVKRLCAELNKADAAPAAAAEAQPSAGGSRPAPAAVEDPETHLPAWPASGINPGDHLRGGPGGIFTAVEIGQSLDGGFDGRGGDEGDIGFRQSLVELGRNWAQQRRLFILQDERQERCG